MGRVKRVLTNFRVIILLICLALGLFAINPRPWNEGVSIKAIARNSSAELAGFESPKATLAPMGRERIIAMNNRPIADLKAYFDFVETLEPDQTVSIKTSKGSYKLVTIPRLRFTELNETEVVLVNRTVEVNETVNGTVQLVNATVTEEVERKKVVSEVVGVEPLGFSVDNAPKSNLRRGLDLQGGTRVLLRPAEQVSSETMGLMVDSLKERLNVYGLGDVVVNEVSDRPGFLGEGNRFILVEIAGATEEEVRDLLGKQGKFEARIGNETVFKGGDDITYVCKTAQCSGIDPERGCGSSPEGWGCSFMFSITLSPDAARRQADLTRDLSVVSGSLSEQLVLFLDDAEVDRLSIAADLRGRAVTDIAITGGGQGATESAAIEDALKNMKRLQTILITGSLPVKIDIERIDNISPTLGKEFLRNALYVGLLALAGVAIVLMIVYRKVIIAFPIVFTAISEIFLTLAMAALIGWNIDLAAIAGIVLAIGTGVNDQIVITDEAIRRQTDFVFNWKDRIKRAFFIIFSAYLTIVVAMIPLLFAGAGLLKGFAITTILAVTIGVLITRPAYAAIVQMLLE
jgi:preprotein translocase subunit SecD